MSDDRPMQPAAWDLLIALRTAELAHEMPNVRVDQIAELIMEWINLHDSAHDWPDVAHEYGRKYPKFGGL